MWGIFRDDFKDEIKRLENKSVRKNPSKYMSKTDCLRLQINLEHRLTRIETIIGLTFLLLVSRLAIDFVAYLVG